ncbi:MULTISPECIES: glutathione S-transferase family protein [Duganella]|jgi:glutathione S-transferase|uniref:glutathione S-transferase family protein n=1 Tax=Duganella TaxID=75654 RepID=UPI0030E7BA4A
MILYHSIAARSFRPLWMLEELGLAYELRVMAFPPRVHDRSYLDINPCGTVPAFFDGAVRMTESAAICQYLAERHPAARLNVALDEADYGAWLNDLHFGEATLTFPQTLVLRYGRFETPERLQPQVVEDYSRWFLSRLKTLTPRLEQADCLCAGRFTAADISVGYALLLAEQLGLHTAFTPAVAAYWQRLRQRPAFVRAQEAERNAAIAQGVSTVPAPLSV